MHGPGGEPAAQIDRRAPASRRGPFCVRALACFDEALRTGCAKKYHDPRNVQRVVGELDAKCVGAKEQPEQAVQDGMRDHEKPAAHGYVKPSCHVREGEHRGEKDDPTRDLCYSSRERGGKYSNDNRCLCVGVVASL